MMTPRYRWRKKQNSFFLSAQFPQFFYPFEILISKTSVFIYQLQNFSIFKLKEQPPKIRMSQIWKRECPFFGSSHPPFRAGGGTPTSGPQEGGWGDHAFKKLVGGQGTSQFWERGGTPLQEKRPLPPQAIGRQNMPLEDNSTRSTGFGNAGMGGYPHLRATRGGVGGSCF